MKQETANPALATPAAAREPSPTDPVPNRRDDHFYEELSRVNNELANLQRELAQTNADLVASHKKLEASEQRYRNLNSCSPIGILELDAAGRCLYANPQWQTSTGLTVEGSLGDGWQRALDPRDVPAFLKERNLALHGRQEFSREVRFVTTRGGQRWAQFRSRALPAEGGKAAGRICTVEDITERKLAEDTLKEQFALRERLAKIAANVPGIIYSFRLRPDGSSCIPYASPTIEEFCGARAGDLVDSASALFELIHADDQARIQESIAESARTMSPWRAEFRVRHPKKGLFWVEGQSSPEREADGSILWHGFIGDITERKRAEESLRESEEKFHQLADSITDVFWITSPDLKTMHYVNEGYQLIWGRSTESLYAHPHQWIEAILPEEREHVFAIFTTLMGDTPEVSVEYRIARPDGTIRWIHDRGFQVRDPAGNLIRLSGIASDITERKRITQELAEHKANEESARLALEHEQKSSQIKSRFVSMVSHEFRTPLSIINMAAELLDGYLDKMTVEERCEHLNEIKSSVERMTQMMNDFLIHGNCASGKIECKPARVEVEALCLRLIAEAPGGASPARRIECAVDPAVGEAWLDEKILRHILGNLLSNAVKYSSASQPVKLEVKRVAGSPQPNGFPDPVSETHLEFKVTDAGIGIPAADMAKLFQTFHRAANVGNRPGTGMGLAIVKQFVDLQGGRIRLESEEGKGTTVWVQLPIASPASPAER